MQSRSIKVGEVYSLKRYRYSSEEKVTVLEKGLERIYYSSSQNYSARQRKMDGIKVRYEDSGHESVVAPRAIYRTWAEAQEDARQQAEWRAQSDEWQREASTKRIHQAKQLHDLLAKAGRPAQRQRVYDHEVAKAQDIFESVFEHQILRNEDEDGYRWGWTVFTPVENLGDVLDDGDVDLGDVAFLMEHPHLWVNVNEVIAAQEDDSAGVL